MKSMKVNNFKQVLGNKYYDFRDLGLGTGDPSGEEGVGCEKGQDTNTESSKILKHRF